MPIAWRVDRKRKLVLTEPKSTLTTEDLFSYQREAWSKPGLEGFDELVDMARVEKIDYEGAGKVRDLAALSTSMDRGPSKMAIVAAKDLEFGLGRMYGAYRTAQEGSQRGSRLPHPEGGGGVAEAAAEGQGLIATMPP